MPVSRKRARAAEAAPPLWRQRARLKRSHLNGGVEPSLLAPTAGISALALIAHARLAARDSVGAARALSVLLARYRRDGKSTWTFPREAVAVAGALSRRNHHTAPKGFLEYVADDKSMSSNVAPGSGAEHVRAMALVEVALDHVAAGRLHEAHTFLTNRARLPTFEDAFLVHLFLGLVSLAYAQTSTSDRRQSLLEESAEALDKAANLNPTEYICAHAAAAVEMQRAGGDVSAGIARYRAFVNAQPANAFAQAALLKALRALPRQPHQELVNAARALHHADPMAHDALGVLREAAAWSWDVHPSVSPLEVANVSAGVVEHGGGDTDAWRTVADCLRACSEKQRITFWTGSGRDKWWPTHFFRIGRLNADRQVDGLCAAKADVGLLLDAAIPYVSVVSPEANNGNLC